MPMSLELISSLTSGWAGDVEKLIAVYDSACVFTDKAFNIVHHGHEGIREVFKFSFDMMPDFKVHYGSPALTELNGAVEWTFTGTFYGDFEGKAYDGVPVSVEGASFMTFRDGKVLTNTDYWNVQSLGRQLSA